MNLNWKPILKTILDDPQEFIATGGWDFLRLDQTDSDEEGEEESEGAAQLGRCQRKLGDWRPRGGALL